MKLVRPIIFQIQVFLNSIILWLISQMVKKRNSNRKIWSFKGMKTFNKQNQSSSKLVILCVYLVVQSEIFFSLVIFTSIDEVLTLYNGCVLCEISPLTKYVTHIISRDRYLQNGHNKQSNSPCNHFRFFFLPVIHT